MSDDGKERERLPHGAYSQIARRLRPKVSVQAVKDVYLGRRESVRISRAIENYVARIERKKKSKAA